MLRAALHVAKTRDVDAVGAIAERRLVRERLRSAAGARAVVVVHDELAEHPAGVREAVGERGVFGIEQEPHRLDRRRAEEHDLARELRFVARDRVDHAHAGRAALLWVVEHFGDDAVGQQREVARRARRGERRRDAAEVRVGDATLFARATVVASETSVVILRENRDASDREHALAVERLHDLGSRVFLDDGHLHGREKDSVGQLRQPFVRAAHADEPLHVLVPRRDVRVANWPVVAVAVSCIRFEIEIAPAVDLTSPHDRAAADLTSAQPVEGRVVGRRVRIVRVLDEELVPDLVAGVAAALHRILALHLLAVAHAAVVHLPRLDVLDVVDARIDRTARLEDERAESTLSQLLRGPAARHSGSDDDRVVVVRVSHGRVFRSSRARV